MLKDTPITIELTENQYECLLGAVEIGSSMYGILGDVDSKKYGKRSDEAEALRSYLLSLAPEYGAGEIVERFENEIVVSDALSEKLEEALDDYDDEIFWFELETRLGNRDFERMMTEDEKKEMKASDGPYPERIRESYESWRKEFERHGIERLGIAEKAIGPDLLRRTSRP